MRWIVFVFATLLLFFSCKKIERINPVDGIVGVQTSDLRQIDLSSVQIGSTLQITEEVTHVTQRGVCWSKNLNPTSANDFVTQGNGFGTFQSKITGLAANTTYYFRSFASNEKTTAYGNEVSYSIKAPVLSTKIAIDVTYTSSKIGGELINKNGFDVVEYGIYWGVFPGISSENSKLTATQKDFYLNLTELENGKTYYYRTFVETNLGIAFGEELSFNTLGYNTPSLLTKLVTSIGTNTAMSGGEITSDGGLAITEKGVCWSTISNPTITGNKTNDGSGSADFKSQLTGLKEGAKYYVRVYANNSKGTSYGNEVSFTTSSNSSVIITDIDGNTYKKVTIGTQTWMAENLRTSKYNDGTVIPNITVNTIWSNLTTGAWSYYNNDAANNAKYGKLYNWYAVSPTTIGNKSICPTGWHVPSDAEWTVLTDYLGGSSVAGGKLKEVGTTSWVSPNTESTNKSLFTGLPGGNRNDGGNYCNVGFNGFWWSSTEGNPNNAWDRYLKYDDGNAYRSYSSYKRNGFSVRCLRD